MRDAGDRRIARLRTFVRRSICAAIPFCLALPSLARAQHDAAGLDRLEVAAEAILSVVRCGHGVERAMAQRAFGPADSLGAMYLCARAESPQLGANFGFVPGRMRAANLRLVDLETGRRVFAPYDTAALSAQLEAYAVSADACTGGAATVPERVPIFGVTVADTIEVWFTPETQFGGGRSGWEPRSLGGECGVVVTPDGRRVVRVLDARTRWRTFSDSTSRTPVIESTEDDLPLFSEVLAAMQLAFAGRSSVIQTRRWRYQRAGAMWIVMPRGGP